MGRLIKVEDFAVYRDEHYNSFPSIVTGADGELIAAFRQAPDRLDRFPNGLHVDPASKAVCVRSLDGGRTWTEKPELLYDDYGLGISDPCLTQLRDGTLLATYFTHQVLLQSDVPELLSHKMDRRFDSKWIIRAAPAFTMRSVDGGRGWDEPQPIPAVQIGEYPDAAVERVLRGHVVERDDGSILALMCTRPRLSGRAHLCVSKDRGVTWETLSHLPNAEHTVYYEPILYRAPSGKLVAFLRSAKANAPKERANPLFTCESLDGGLTWTGLREHRIYTPNPFDIIGLREGGALLTYGYRHKPYGIRARLLDAECEAIEEAEEVVLRDDGGCADMGYPGAVQLADGELVIVYYFADNVSGKRYIAGTRCKLA